MAGVLNLSGDSLSSSNIGPLAVLYDRAPTAFNIEGVTGGADSTIDDLLSSGLVPTVYWEHTDFEDSYDITIYESNGTTTACSTQNVTVDTTSSTFTGCNLNIGRAYKAKVISKDSVTEVTATNDMFDFILAPTISISDVTVSENVGSSEIAFEVTLSATADRDITFDWNTVDDTAVSSGTFQDFVAASGSETISAGSATKTVSITLINDPRDEPDQSFNFIISNLTNSTTSDATAVGTITDDDLPPTISVTNSITTEGDASSFSTSLSVISEKSISFSLTTTNFNAISGTDFVGGTLGPFTIDPGISSTTALVSTIEDSDTCEITESYSITLDTFTNVTATPSGVTVTATIFEDDYPTFIISDTSVLEGSKANFKVSLSKACPNFDVTVDWSALALSAKATLDFEMKSGTLNYPIGATTSNIIIQTAEDNSPETNEYFSLGLLNTTYGTIEGSSIGKALIQDNDVSASLGVLKVAAGSYHTCALLTDRTVKCWGSTENGKLGIPYQNLGDDPGEMGDNLNYVDLGTGRTALSISQGPNHACAILDNYKIKCWGNKSEGSLGYHPGSVGNIGDGPNEMGDSLAYVELGPTATPSKTSSGNNFNCVLFTDGKIKCFGSNSYGYLGYGDTNARDYSTELGSSLKYVDLGTGRTAKDLISGNYHTCVILDDDNVKCWGRNSAGQLGQGHTNNLGDGPNEMGDNLSVIDLGTGRTAKSIHAGSYHTCVVLDNDQAKCFGNNYNGSLGAGTASYDHRGDEPGEMGDNLDLIDLGTGRTISKFYSSGSNNCAILDDSTLKCFGPGSYGVNGQDNSTNYGDDPGEMGDTLPTVNVGAGRTAQEIFITGATTCALLDNNTTKCWGYNDWGQLGRGDTEDQGNNAGEMAALPVLDLGAGRTVSKFPTSSRGDTVCVILDNNKVKCWGETNSGSSASENLFRGDGANEMGANTTVVDLSDVTPVDIEAMANSTCVITTEGKVKCWGYASYGLLAHGVSISAYPSTTGQMGNNLPFSNLGTNVKVSRLAGGSSHMCALTTKGKVKCWGAGEYGRLGYENDDNLGDNASEVGDNLAYVDLGTGRRAIDISAGYEHTCVLLDDLTIKCWGRSNYGQLGYENTLSIGDEAQEMGDNLPAVDLGTGKKAISLTVGYQSTCVILNDGDMICFGDNGEGQLGIETTEHIGNGSGEMGDNLVAVKFPTGISALRLASKNHGRDLNCAIVTGERLQCWGSSDYGQRGEGYTSMRGGYPNQMNDNLPFVDLGTNKTPKEFIQGRYSVCAILTDGGLKCWGRNEEGYLGQEHSNNIGDRPNELGDNLPIINLTSSEVIGDFVIEGVTGGADATQDEWLANDEVTVGWTAATAATNYKITIYESDMTTVKCAEQSTAGMSYSFVGCTLTEGEIYRIKLIADDGGGGNTRYASNTFFIFTVDQSAPASFSVLGATGGNDNSNDATLADGLYVTANWQASSGASQYEVTIYESNGTTIKCPKVDIDAGTTSYSFTTCALTDGTNYNIKIEAVDLSSNQIEATNSQFVFSVAEAIPPENFNVLGITGAEDTTVDNTLTSGSWATINFENTNSENLYELTIYEDDGSTVKCATETATINFTSHSFENCNLVNLDNYIVRVFAKDVFTAVEATNSPYTFSINTPAPGSFNILGVRGGASDITSDNQLVSGNTPHIYFESSNSASSYDVSILSNLSSGKNVRI